MSWSSQKKKEDIFSIVYFAQRFVFISVYSVVNTLSEYTYFYKSKNIISYTFIAFF